jgi:uncharacterized protein YcnI
MFEGEGGAFRFHQTQTFSSKQCEGAHGEKDVNKNTSEGQDKHIQ